MNTTIVSQIVLIITAATLFYVGLTDLKHFKIRNEFIIVLTALFFLHTHFFQVAGRPYIGIWHLPQSCF